MLNNKTIVFLTLFFTLLFSGMNTIFAQVQDDQQSKAIKLFKEGNYREAESIFKQLVSADPDNSLLNFYYGASSTELAHFSKTSLYTLKKAVIGEAPSKVFYYLGMQYQARSNWEQALKNYNQFRVRASQDEANELNLAEKIQQCYNRVNPYTISENENAEKEEEVVLPDSVTFTEKAYQKDSSVQKIAAENIEKPEEEPSGIPIEFQVNSKITYLNTSNFKTEKGRKLFEKANSLQKELDFNLKKEDELREEYASENNEMKKKIVGQKILSFENESYKLKDEITQLLVQSRNMENEYWRNASQQEIDDFNAELEKQAKIASVEETSGELDTAAKDTTLKIDPNILLETADADNLIKKPANQDELVYKIQIGAYSRGLPAYVEKLYKKLSLIRKIDHYTDENGVVVYTTGNLKNLEDAIKMRNQVRQEGVEDAFVVPYFNGKRITLDQAKKIEADL